MSINSVNLTGRLGTDPSLRYTKGGQAVTDVRLAINNGFKDKQKTTWVTVVLWDKQAELVAQYLKKGNQVGISGRLELNEYERDGQKMERIRVVAEKVEFLDSANSGNRTQSAAAGADTGTEEEPPF